MGRIQSSTRGYFLYCTSPLIAASYSEITGLVDLTPRQLFIITSQPRLTARGEFRKTQSKKFTISVFIHLPVFNMAVFINDCKLIISVIVIDQA